MRRKRAPAADALHALEVHTKRSREPQRVAGAGELACRVHAELRHADIDRGDPNLVAVIGPMVLPHGMLLRLTKVCHGTPAASKTRCSIADESAEVA